MTKKHLYTTLLLLMMLISCTRKGDTNTDRPILTVSIEPQRKMLEEIAGDRFEVVSILGGGTNAETYEPSVGQRSVLDRSKAFFITGHLPFESKLASSVSGDMAIVDTSAGIVPVTGTHSHNDGSSHADTETADPHVWTSYPNAALMVEVMANAMAEIDPYNAQEYAARAAGIISRLDSLHRSTAQRINDKGVHAFAVWHPSLSYYARDYGLEQITMGNEGKEISAGNMRRAIDRARSHSVTTLFFQKEYDLRQAQTINRELGSKLVEINPLAYEWEDELKHITDELTR